MTSHRRRLDMLKATIRPIACPKCGDHPARIVTTDEGTGETSETIPEGGCPACGRPPYCTIHLVGSDDAE